MKKYVTKYDPEDIAEIINNLFTQVESPEGERFKTVHILKDTVMIAIQNKTFIINIVEKSKLS